MAALAARPVPKPISWIPDAIGNLFKDRSRTDRKYGPAGQLLESRTAAGVTTYEYDAEGNLIRKVAPGDKVWSYEWNAGGMLARVIRPDGESVEFKYDPLGRRIAKTYKGKTTKWVWDGKVPLHEWTEECCAESNGGAKSVPNGNVETVQASHQVKIAPISAQGPPAEYNSQSSIFNSQLVTWLFEPESFAPMAKIVDGQSYSIVTDYLGTPFEMYNGLGQRTWAAELDIYGAVRVVQEGAAVDCPFRFPGQYADEETGLYYNRFRYYDPEVGGYVSQDPIGLAGGNPTLYGYVNDPLGWVDELGLSCGNLPKSHRQFSKGASVFVPERVIDRLKSQGITKLGKDSLFVVTRQTGAKLSKRNNKAIEKALGIPAGSWKGKIKRFDIAPENMKNIRLPNGTEGGANSLFKTGGKTSGGELEAVIEPVSISDLIPR